MKLIFRTAKHTDLIWIRIHRYMRDLVSIPWDDNK